jgi:hypothetical protein
MTNTEHFRRLSCYHPCIICRRWMMRMVGHVTSIDRHTAGKHHPSGAGPRPVVRSADNDTDGSCGFLRPTTEHTRPSRDSSSTNVSDNRWCTITRREEDGRRRKTRVCRSVRRHPPGGSTWSSPDHDVIGHVKYSGCQGVRRSPTL